MCVLGVGVTGKNTEPLGAEVPLRKLVQLICGLLCMEVYFSHKVYLENVNETFRVIYSCAAGRAKVQWLHYFSLGLWVGEPSGAGRMALAGRSHVVEVPRGPEQESSAGSFTHTSGPWAGKPGTHRGWAVGASRASPLHETLSTPCLQHRASEKLTPFKTLEAKVSSSGGHTSFPLLPYPGYPTHLTFATFYL